MDAAGAARLAADTWRHCLTFVTGLELLRVNVCSSALHEWSSGPAAVLPQWRGFVELSDRLRRNIFRGGKTPTYSGALDRARAIAILRRRCQYCRLHNCRYVNEFRPRERVCERCERERHLSTFKLVANPSALGLTTTEIQTLNSIERGTGRSAVTLYLASDIQSLLEARQAKTGVGGHGTGRRCSSDESDSSDYDDYDNPKVKKWKQRRRDQFQGAKRSRKRGNKLGRPMFLETSHYRGNSRRTKNRNQKSKRFTDRQQEQYDVAVSGFSCLMLAD